MWYSPTLFPRRIRSSAIWFWPAPEFQPLMLPHPDCEAGSSAHAILSKMPLLETVTSTAQHSPGLLPLPILPPTPNPSPLATMLPSGWLFICNAMWILLLQNFSLPSDVIYFHIFSIKLEEESTSHLLSFSPASGTGHGTHEVLNQYLMNRGRNKYMKEVVHVTGLRCGTRATSWTHLHHHPNT